MLGLGECGGCPVDELTDESVAERYDRIRRELRETVERDEAALERRLAKARERRRAEAKAVTSRPWWVRLRDWWRGMK